jgi:hypothetical protein
MLRFAGRMRRYEGREPCQRDVIASVVQNAPERFGGLARFDAIEGLVGTFMSAARCCAIASSRSLRPSANLP